MARRIGVGPVFASECLTTSRRWQVYAGRTLLLSSVLVGLTLVWLNRLGGRGLANYSLAGPELPTIAAGDRGGTPW